MRLYEVHTKIERGAVLSSGDKVPINMPVGSFIAFDDTDGNGSWWAVTPSGFTRLYITAASCIPIPLECVKCVELVDQ